LIAQIPDAEIQHHPKIQTVPRIVRTAEKAVFRRGESTTDVLKMTFTSEVPVRTVQ
jgi:hypothetical protein